MYIQRDLQRLVSEEEVGPSAVIAPAPTEAITFLLKNALACCPKIKSTAPSI